ncbi:hypothetical protein PR048_020656 [Dryococelus australis]|uniref:Uncharacterized protein n=1 Tax=Dryococelus australis TaxID=614101 RepID=A0ABQ9H6Y5_9NEOP|nr:hypothetical protein PR048_020656 [Dryococelus australis]
MKMQKWDADMIIRSVHCAREGEMGYKRAAKYDGIRKGTLESTWKIRIGLQKSLSETHYPSCRNTVIVRPADTLLLPKFLSNMNLSRSVNVNVLTSSPCKISLAESFGRNKDAINR